MGCGKGEFFLREPSADMQQRHEKKKSPRCQRAQNRTGKDVGWVVDAQCNSRKAHQKCEEDECCEEAGEETPDRDGGHHSMERMPRRETADIRDRSSLWKPTGNLAGPRPPGRKLEDFLDGHACQCRKSPESQGSGPEAQAEQDAGQRTHRPVSETRDDAQGHKSRRRCHGLGQAMTEPIFPRNKTNRGPELSFPHLIHHVRIVELCCKVGWKKRLERCKEMSAELETPCGMSGRRLREKGHQEARRSCRPQWLPRLYS